MKKTIFLWYLCMQLTHSICTASNQIVPAITKLLQAQNDVLNIAFNDLKAFMPITPSPSTPSKTSSNNNALNKAIIDKWGHDKAKYEQDLAKQNDPANYRANTRKKAIADKWKYAY